MLLVVIFHTGGGAQSTNRLVRAFGHLIQVGWSGVTLFFILSGFLITGILWDTRQSEHWLKNFYIRRVLRIFPLYYGTLLLVLITAIVSGHAMLGLSRLWVFAAYLQNVPPFTELTSGYGSSLRLYHFWSLAVEEQFYLVWPFLIFRMRTLRQARYLCLTVFFLSFAFRLVSWRFFQDPNRFDGFILARAGELAAGAFFAMCYRDESWRKVDRFAPALFAVGLAGSLAVFLSNGSFQLHSPSSLIYGLGFITLFGGSILVLALREGSLVNKAMNAAWLRWIGGISYGIYIFHVLLISVYEAIVLRIMPRAGRTQLLVLEAVTNITLSFLLAWLSFRFFESPFLKLRSRFSSASKAVPA